jgi:hypothetical protein
MTNANTERPAGLRRVCAAILAVVSVCVLDTACAITSLPIGHAAKQESPHVGGTTAKAACAGAPDNSAFLKAIGAIQPLPFEAAIRPTVRIVDSGIAPHESLLGSLDCAAVGGDGRCASYSWSVSGHVDDPTNNPVVSTEGCPGDHGSDHATEVAGVIGAVCAQSGMQYGIAPLAHLQSWTARANPCDPPLEDSSQRAAAIAAAAITPAASPVRVINLSWMFDAVGSCPEPLQQALKMTANRRSIVMVAAAGNGDGNLDDIGNRTICPAMMSLPGLVTVAEMKDGRTITREGNWGAGHIQLAAATPGVWTTPANDGGRTCPHNLAQMDRGSSFAAAAVSGMAAMVFAHPNYQKCSASQVVALLRCHACRPTDQGNDDFKFWVNPFGGMANIAFLGSEKPGNGQPPHDFCAGWNGEDVGKNTPCAAIPNETWSADRCKGFKFQGGRESGAP